MINLDAVIREAEKCKERIDTINGKRINRDDLLNQFGTEIDVLAQLIKGLAQAIQESRR